MKKPVTRTLPHGALPFRQIADPNLREAVMKLNENIRSLSLRLKTAEEAIREMQRRS